MATFSSNPLDSTTVQITLMIERIKAAFTECIGAQISSDSPSAVPHGASERRTYFDVDALLDSVESGAIAPLKGRWLVQLHMSLARGELQQLLMPSASTAR